jgi:hypothetical protein
MNINTTIAQKTTFNHAGGNIFLNDGAVALAKIPAATYTIEVTPKGQVYLSAVPDLGCSGRLYGDIEKRADRVMNTFEDRPAQTGVILSGEKGSGKTLLARMLAQRCREDHGMPTIMINKAYPGDMLLSFLKQIDQPYVLFIDEFEKVYASGEKGDGGAQASLLSLFDGVLTSKRLLVVTVNETHKVSDFLKNRPGRFYYSFDYAGLDEGFIRDYCAENLRVKKNVESVVAVSIMFDAFNFDMLQALIEEMNRYDEKAQESLAFLNVKPGNSYVRWTVAKFLVPKKVMDQAEKAAARFRERHGQLKEVELTHTIMVEDSHCLSPLSGEAEVRVVFRLDGQNVLHEEFEFTPNEIVKITGGCVYYKNEDGQELVLKREYTRKVDYTSLVL